MREEPGSCTSALFLFGGSGFIRRSLGEGGFLVSSAVALAKAGSWFHPP